MKSGFGDRLHRYNAPAGPAQSCKRTARLIFNRTSLFKGERNRVGLHFLTVRRGAARWRKVGEKVSTISAPTGCV